MQFLVEHGSNMPYGARDTQRGVDGLSQVTAVNTVIENCDSESTRLCILKGIRNEDW